MRNLQQALKPESDKTIFEHLKEIKNFGQKRVNFYGSHPCECLDIP